MYYIRDKQANHYTTDVIVPMKPFHLSKNNLFHFIVFYILFLCYAY
jgi:hypothetical protein